MSRLALARLLLGPAAKVSAGTTFDWSALSPAERADILFDQPPRRFASSGTTGTPTTITRSAAQLVAELDVTVAALGDAYDGVHATVSPHSLYGYVASAMAARLGVPINYDPWGAGRVPVRGDAPLVFTVAASWRSLGPTVRSESGRRATFVHAGSSLPASALEVLDGGGHADARFLDLFGTTETGLLGARRVRPDVEDTWTICHDTTMVFPPGAEVEARPIVSGPRVCGIGPDPRASVLLDDWLIPTGVGTFGFAGRRQRLIKPGGRRVDLDLLEAEIATLVPEVDTACVPRRHDSLGEHVELLVAADPATAEAVRSRLRAAWPKRLAVVPRWVTAVDHIDKSPMGKVRRLVGPQAEVSR